MAILIRCLNCKSDFALHKKICPVCGTPVGKTKTYRVSISYKGKKIKRIVGHSLALAKEVESKLKADIVSGKYYEGKEKEIEYSFFMEQHYFPLDKNKKSIKSEKAKYEKWIKL